MWRALYKTLVFCGSLASLYSYKPASPSPVSASCSTSLRAHFLAQVCKHRLATVLPAFLTVLARIRAITSLSIGAVGNCLVVRLVGYAPQPARVPSCTVLWFLCWKSMPRLGTGAYGFGPCFCGEPSDSQNQWSDAAS